VPLSTMALWKSGQESGETRCQTTEKAPALSPKSVTRVGSPPKPPMLSLTHSRAARWSRSAMFPVEPAGSSARSASAAKKPRALSL